MTLLTVLQKELKWTWSQKPRSLTEALTPKVLADFWQKLSSKAVPMNFVDMGMSTWASLYAIKWKRSVTSLIFPQTEEKKHWQWAWYSHSRSFAQRFTGESGRGSSHFVRPLFSLGWYWWVWNLSSLQIWLVLLVLVKAECPLNEFCTLGQNLLELILDPKLLPFVHTNCVAFCCYQISLCSQIVLHFVDVRSICAHILGCMLLLQFSLCPQIVLHFVVISLCSHIVIRAMKHYECDDCVN